MKSDDQYRNADAIGSQSDNIKRDKTKAQYFVVTPWMQIAIESAMKARRAREFGVPASKYASTSSESLSAEMRYSMDAICAVCFALEALKIEIHGKPLYAGPGKADGEKATAGYHIGHLLSTTFGIPYATSPLSQLEEIFRIRNGTVHFKGEMRVLSELPSGVLQFHEQTVYTAEAAEYAVKVALDVIKLCAQSKPKFGQLDDHVKILAEFEEQAKLPTWRQWIRQLVHAYKWRFKPGY